MAKPNDKVFRDQLLSYLKNKWMLAGQQPFSETIKQITIDLFGNHNSTNQNKVFQYIHKLANSGYIKIDRGNGGSAKSTYIFIDDNIVEQIQNTRDECLETIENVSGELTYLNQKIVNLFINQSNQLVAAIGEIDYLKKLLLNLEFDGYGPNGLSQRFKAGAYSDVNEAIERIKKEEQQKKEQQEKTGSQE